jgi:protein ImuA
MRPETNLPLTVTLGHATALPQPPTAGDLRHTRSQLVARLREELSRLERARRPEGGPSISTGCQALDRLLPAGGLLRGTLVEWLAADEASGAACLALAAAREACRDDGPLLVVDGEEKFYPPAAALAGIDLERLIVVRVHQPRDETWALDQALRTPGLGAVLGWTRQLSQRAARRLQLAAEASGGLGLLVRPEQARHEPCWAEARLLVRPQGGMAGRRLQVELLRARGAASSSMVELEIDDETGVVRLAAQLAPTGRRQRSAGA